MISIAAAYASVVVYAMPRYGAMLLLMHDVYGFILISAAPSLYSSQLLTFDDARAFYFFYY